MVLRRINANMDQSFLFYSDGDAVAMALLVDDAYYYWPAWTAISATTGSLKR